MKLPRIILFLCLLGAACAAEKPRVFVLTDIENEPDDTMSMVRLMTYANHFEIEGLAATTSTHLKNRVAPDRIRRAVGAYAKVRDNLEKHEAGFPTGDQLLAVVTEGLPVYGLDGVGEGKDSPASERLIKTVDRADPRPVWVPVWGGPNVLAQALWKVRATRSAADLDRFVAKLRVYTISDQDDSGPWIRKEFPELFYIVSPGVNAGGGYHFATWSGISGDNFHARCDGADFSLVTNEWLDANIRRKGPLGAEYPRWEYLMEGDTPSFLGLINNGLNSPEHPDWGGWGGRYELYTPRTEKWFVQPETRPIWTNAMDEVLGVDGHWHLGNHETIWRWRGVSKRLRGANGLDDQALRGGEPSPRGEARASLRAKRQTGRSRRAERRRHDRPRRPGAFLRVVRLQRTRHLFRGQRALRPAG